MTNLKMKSYAFTDKCEINLQNMNTTKRKEKHSRKQTRNNEMSTKTMDFIQKICYKKTASVDMTRHGFISDSKVYPVNLLLRPLKSQLEKICGNHSRNSSARRISPVEKVGTGTLSASVRTPGQSFSTPSSSARCENSSVTTTSDAKSSATRRSVRNAQVPCLRPSRPKATMNEMKKNVRLVLPAKRKNK